MAYYLALGYHLTPRNVTGEQPAVDGSVILASGLAMHTLARRRFRGSSLAHLRQRLFDPQLYMSSMDPGRSPRACAYLASYRWFGVPGLEEYDSGEQKQADWLREAEKRIADLWTRQAPSDPRDVIDYAEECIDFQHRIGCEAFIAPSPLTLNSASDYGQELMWLDAALDYAHTTYSGSEAKPVLATIALADACVRYDDPEENPLLEQIADAVSARGVDGAYLVLEQGGEPDHTRHCGDTRALRAILHLVHILAHECSLYVAVNFLGHFGLACEAVGASMWASGWYKSTYRLRIADKIAGGYAVPSYWSSAVATDVHLAQEFDHLVRHGLLDTIADETEASAGLIDAARNQKPVVSVPAWSYSRSNVGAAMEHYFRSCVNAERRLDDCSGEERLSAVEEWLAQAVDAAERIQTVLGQNAKTQTGHVAAWYDAFRAYRRDHSG